MSNNIYIKKFCGCYSCMHLNFAFSNIGSYSKERKEACYEGDQQVVFKSFKR